MHATIKSSAAVMLDIGDSVRAPTARPVLLRGYLCAVLYVATSSVASVAHAQDTAYWKPTPTGAIACSLPTTRAGGTPDGLIDADTPSADRTRMFPQRSTFSVVLVTAAPSADRVTWSIGDQLGHVVGHGTFAVPRGPQTSTLSCTSTASGYFAVSATLSKAGGTLPQAGTRPAGIATFGILPDLSDVVPAVTYRHQDQHRFGLEGFNGWVTMLTKLGVSRIIDDRQLSFMEPKGPDTWTPSLSDLDPAYKGGAIMRLLRLDGIPAWASPTGAYQDDTHAPKDLDYYRKYMARVGADTAAIREAYFPKQRNDYYQVTWEPDWKDTPSHFVALYEAVYKGLHSTDPNAVVMGTTSPNPGDCSWCTSGILRRHASFGLGKYIDGVATHAYYSAHPSPSQPPEQYDTDRDPAKAAKALDKQMRALRAQMQAVKPNMPLWSSELSIGYDPGAAYGPNTPSANELYAQAAVAARAHLIVLGEGAQVTYFFFGADYPSEVGYGTFFDIVDPKGSYTPKAVSPKPQAMAFAAMTRIVDGTLTLGRLNGLPQMVYGYAFQQLGGGAVITALWTHDNANWPTPAGIYSPTSGIDYSLKVDNAGTNGTVTVLDMMGNAYTVRYADGVVNLALTESPIYVVSKNASVMTAQVTAPIGYTGQ